MGPPLDINAEIDEIIENLESTNKMVNFRMETATVEALQNLFLIKPKIVLLSCHGDYDKEDKTYFLAFESKNIGVMEKLDMNRIKILFETQKHTKSIECMIVSACRSQNIGKLMNESGVPVVIAINAPFKVQDEAARSFGKKHLYLHWFKVLACCSENIPLPLIRRVYFSKKWSKFFTKLYPIPTTK